MLMRKKLVKLNETFLKFRKLFNDILTPISCQFLHKNEKNRESKTIDFIKAMHGASKVAE